MNLIDAIGPVAVIALRDYLNRTYPPNVETRDHNNPVHPEVGDKYHIVHHHSDTGGVKRSWFKIVETETGRTAVWQSPRTGRNKSLVSVGLKQDFFLSYDEAFRAMDRLS